MFLDLPRALALALLCGFTLACNPGERSDPDGGTDITDGGGDGGIDGEDCGPSNCSGCCLDDGTCVHGDEVERCGSGGAACADCSFDGICGEARTCESSGECEGATLIDLSSGSALLDGAFPDSGTKLVACEYRETVVGQLFVVNVPRAGVLVARLRVHGDYATATMELSSGCRGDSLACEANDLWDASPELAELRRSVPAGRYSLAIQTWDESAGAAFELDVHLVDAPSNDTCDAAIALEFSNGLASATGSTATASSTAPDGCVSSGGDVFYRFTLDEPRNVEVRATPTADDVRLGLKLLTGDCDSTLRSCSQPLADGEGRLFPGTLPAGNWLLAVDSQQGHAGPFSLEVATREVAAGGSCATADPIVFIRAGDVRRATITEDLQPHGKDDPLDCSDGWNIRHDIAYAFTLDEPSSVSMSIRWPGYDNGILHMNLVTADCARDSSLACESEYLNDVRDIELGAVPAGEYRIVVSAFLIDEDSPSVFELNLEVEPSLPGESCTNPLSLGEFAIDGLSPELGGEARVNGDTTEAVRDVSHFCGGSTTRGRDHVYAFSTTVPMNLHATMTSNTPQFRTALVLREAHACNDSQHVECAAETGSTTSGFSTLTRTALPPGDWVLIADGAARASYISDKDGGEYELNVRLTPTLEGESCAHPHILEFSDGAAGGTVEVSGSTVGFIDDYRTCFGSAADVVYEFTTDRRLNLRASVTGGLPAPGVWLARDGACGDSGAACGVDGGGTNALSVGSLAAGTYRLIVDAKAAANTGFDYTLTASLTPAEQGDACALPLPLAFSDGEAGGTATVTGNTLEFFDQQAPCGNSDPDVFYTFTTDRILNFRATVAAADASGFSGTISLLDSCASLSTDQCWNSLWRNKTAIERAALPPGTYLVSVNGKGKFELDAELEEPLDGDGCHNPLPLFPVGQNFGTTSFQVDLEGLVHDRDTTCSYAQKSRDIFYSFSTSEPMNLRVRAESLAEGLAYGPHLSVLPAGCTGAAKACLRNNWTQESVLDVVMLPPGDWVLLLDEQDVTEYYRGPFEVTVRLEPPGPGEVCDTALPLEFPNGDLGGSVTVEGDTTEFFDTFASSCSRGGAGTVSRDVVYGFTITETMNLRVGISTPSSTFKPSVFHASRVGDTCGYDSRLCAYVPQFAQDEIGDYAALPPGEHFLVVDAPGVHVGPYSLTAKLMPIVPGESCDDPLPLTLVNGEARVNDSIENWFPDETGSCQSLTSGEDAVYSFTTNGPRYVRATVTTDAPTSDFTPGLYLSSGTCRSTEIDCAQSTDSSTASIAARVDAGSHFLVVDSGLRKHGKGDYQLDVFVGDPPQGDSCADPIPLMLSNGAAGGTAVVEGDTTLFTGTLTPSCGGSPASPLGRDVVYSFTTDRTLNLSATLKPGTMGGWDGTLSLRSTSCTSPTPAETCVSGAGPLTPKTLNRDALPAGTHYLVVDNSQNARGRTYELEVSLTQ